MPWEALVVAGEGKVDAATVAPAQALVVGQRPLVIHFHGGLVDEASGLDLARRLGDQTYGPAGHDALFVVWKTGPCEVIRASLVDALEEVLAKRLIALVLRWAAGKLGDGPGKSLTFAPASLESVLDDEDHVKPFAAELAAAEDAAFALSPAEQRAFENAVAADAGVGQAVQRLVAPAADPGARALGLGGAPPTPTRMDLDTLEEIRAEAAPDGKALVSWAVVARKALAILVRVVRRIADGSHHGLYPTVLQELAREFYLGAAGRFLWTAIRDQAEEAFSASHLAGGVLGDLLVARHAAGAPPPAIVAHSAGSIYTSRLLEHVGAMRDAAKLPATYAFDPVVFLAPAATTTRFARALAAVGPTSARPAFRRFRMFAMTDEVEQADALGGPVVPRSLLYHVAGVAEDAVDTPLVGMQRYFSATRRDGTPRFDDAATTRVKELVAGNTVWSVSQGAAGARSGSRRHGDFDNDPDTLDSVVHFLGGGP